MTRRKIFGFFKVAMIALVTLQQGACAKGLTRFRDDRYDSSGGFDSSGSGSGGAASNGGTSGSTGTTTTSDKSCTPGNNQECYTGDPSTKDVGNCHGGTQTCQDDGTWGSCEGEKVPGDPTCTLDNDCNGKPDVPEEPISCWTGPSQLQGVPPCHPGLKACKLSPDGMTSVWGDCDGELLPHINCSDLTSVCTCDGKQAQEYGLCQCNGKPCNGNCEFDPELKVKFCAPIDKVDCDGKPVP